MTITRIQLRRGSTAAWAAANPVLANGEPGMDTDTEGWKLGDGTSTWTALPFQGSGGSGISPTLFDAKGDLIAATAADTPARLVVGTNGQVLTADTASAAGVKWAAAAGGAPSGTAGGVLSGTYPNPGFAVDLATQAELDAAAATLIPKALVDAAGDLLVGTAADTVGRLGMGTALQTLRVNAGATALEYATPAAGGDGLIPTSKTGFWLTPFPHLATGNAVRVQSRLDCVPLLIQKTVTVNALALRVTTSVAATTFRLGIYADDGTGYPGALIVDAGTVDSASTGDKSVTISQVLTPGLYWLASVAQGGAPGAVTISNQSVLGMPFGIVGTAAFDLAAACAFTQAGVTGALPSTFTLTQATSTLSVRVFAKVA